MLYITKDGLVDAGARVKVKIFPYIERGQMGKVNGIVVHQTGGPTLESAFNSYRQRGAFGAHFLIDHDGTIYQTASLHKMTLHTGKMQSRCYRTHQCAPAEFKIMAALEKSWRPDAISKREYEKTWPDRYPVSSDAVGIEIVGISRTVEGEKDQIYDPVSDAQNASLKWLVKELAETLSVSMTEVFRHPEIARKTPTEASTARW